MELSCIPAVVWSDNLVIPIALNEALKVLAVSWSGVRNVVVRQPSLQLRLVPFVVCLPQLVEDVNDYAR